MGLLGWIYAAKTTYDILVTLNELRKKAREVAQEYIRRRIKEGLVRGLVAAAIQIALLAGVFFWNRESLSLESRLGASACLWIITFYNLFQLCFVSIPEWIKVRKLLQSKIGYTVKYVLQISLVTELLQWNLVFLAACQVLAVSSRTVLGSTFSYTEPWVELFSR